MATKKTAAKPKQPRLETPEEPLAATLETPEAPAKPPVVQHPAFDPGVATPVAPRPGRASEGW